MSKRLDLTGHRYGRLLVLSPAEPYMSPGGQRHARWRCVCECGTELETRGSALRKGISTSCGCRQKDVLRERNTTHGRRHSPEYNTWKAMIDRCEYPKNPSYPFYGGRGVKVCEAWHDIEVFVRDVGPRPSPQHSLDRIDPEGDYEPGNVRWVTKDVQVRNTRRNVWVTYQGQRMILKDAAVLAGLEPVTVFARKQRGEPEEAWFRPAGVRLRSANLSR